MTYTGENTIGKPLADYLRSAGLPVKARDLARQFHTSERAVRLSVNELRQAGVPIASGQDGYWIALEPGDLETTIRNLRSRARVLFDVIRGLERSFGRSAPCKPVQADLWESPVSVRSAPGRPAGGRTTCPV